MPVLDLAMPALQPWRYHPSFRSPLPPTDALNERQTRALAHAQKASPSKRPPRWAQHPGHTYTHRHSQAQPRDTQCDCGGCRLKVVGWFGRAKYGRRLEARYTLTVAMGTGGGIDNMTQPLCTRRLADASDSVPACRGIIPCPISSHRWRRASPPAADTCPRAQASHPTACGVSCPPVVPNLWPC